MRAGNDFRESYQVGAAARRHRIPWIREPALEENDAARDEAPDHRKARHRMAGEALLSCRRQTSHQQRDGAFRRAGGENVQDGGGVGRLSSEKNTFNAGTPGA